MQILKKLFWKSEPENRQEPPALENEQQGIRKRGFFQAAEVSRLSGENWSTTPIPADDVIRREQRAIVSRARLARARNNYVKRYVQMARQNVVGSRGIGLQAQARDNVGTLDTRANDAIEAAWKDWSQRENCDVTGKRSLREFQLRCITDAVIDGEFFVRIIEGKDAGPWGIALQSIDPQRCPVDFDVDKLSNGSFVRHGIEFNRYGRPLAYYFTTTLDEEVDYFYGGRKFSRVPAKEILHGFIEDMPGQKRGMPWVATTLDGLNQLGEYERASVINARISASKGGFFEWADNAGPDPVYEDADDYDIDMKVEPGTFRELPAGVKFKEFNPTFPHGEYAVFLKGQLRSIASGLGVAYNALANDLTDVNFSSIRQGALDERDNWMLAQEWLIDALMRPVFTRWMERCLLAGMITIAGKPLRATAIDKYLQVQFQPRRWQWVDPRADVDANVKAKDNLLVSLSELIREQGRDPDAVWRQIADDVKAMQAAGIDEQYIMLALNSNLVKAIQPPGNENAPAE